MKKAFTWSLQWQIFTATLIVLLATLLLFTWIIGNLFLTAWDRQMTTRLTLVANLAQNDLPVTRLRMYETGDESLTFFTQDKKALQAFAKQYQLDHITFLSKQGRVHIDSGGLLPGTLTAYGALIPQNPAGTLTRLHRNRAGAWQKFMLWPLDDGLLLLLSAGSEMFTVLERVNNRRNLILGIGFLLSLLSSWFTSFVLGKKLGKLSQGFKAIQAGNHGARVKARGNDEIAYLSRNFNEMADEIEHKTRQEREQHAKRIAELKVLSAGIAHEIRNPLGAISGLADLLARQDEIKRSENSVDLVQRIRNEIDRMDKIVLEVMAYARQPELHKQPVAVEKIKNDIQGIDKNCECRIADALPQYLNLDPSGFNSVLRNLLLNAREAAGPGGTVTAYLACARDQFQLTVTDSGPGIPVELLDSIFQPFFTKKSKGTGLGLAIARNIVEAHGGKLTCHSSETGARFTATFPLAQGG